MHLEPFPKLETSTLRGGEASGPPAGLARRGGRPQYLRRNPPLVPQRLLARAPLAEFVQGCSPRRQSAAARLRHPGAYPWAQTVEGHDHWSSRRGRRGIGHGTGAADGEGLVQG